MNKKKKTIAVSIFVLCLVVVVVFSIFISFFIVERREKRKIECNRNLSFVEMDQKYVNGLYCVYEAVHDVLTKHGIAYALIGGSMLGQIRHGGQMPWDDDGDIIINIKDKQKVEALKDEFEQYGMVYWNFISGSLSKVAIKGTDRGFLMNQSPFVDIFWIERENEDDDYFRLRGIMKRSYPNDVYHKNDFPEKVKPRPFAHIKLNSFNRNTCEKYLDNTYGKSWRDTIYIQLPHVKMYATDSMQMFIYLYWLKYSPKIKIRNDFDPILKYAKVKK